MMNTRIVVFSNNASRALGEEICSRMSLPHGQALVGRFSDGEVQVELKENVRGEDVFIVGSTSPPLENAMEMMLLADAARRSSAGRVTYVLPYLGYNRQDRKDKPRVPLSAQVMIRMLLSARPNRAILFDVHSESTLGFFDEGGVITDHLYASRVVRDYLLRLVPQPFKVASVDVGGMARTKKYAKLLEAPYVTFDKTRTGPGQTPEEGVTIVGDLKGFNILFADDMADTCGSLQAVSRAAMAQGALSTYACVAHAMLSGDAISKLDDSPLQELVVTNSIAHPAEKLESARRVKITSLSAATMLATAIRRTHDGDSLSDLIL